MSNTVANQNQNNQINYDMYGSFFYLNKESKDKHLMDNEEIFKITLLCYLKNDAENPLDKYTTLDDLYENSLNNTGFSNMGCFEYIIKKFVEYDNSDTKINNDMLCISKDDHTKCLLFILVNTIYHTELLGASYRQNSYKYFEYIFNYCIKTTANFNPFGKIYAPDNSEQERIFIDILQPYSQDKLLFINHLRCRMINYQVGPPPVINQYYLVIIRPSPYENPNRILYKYNEIFLNKALNTYDCVKEIKTHLFKNRIQLDSDNDFIPFMKLFLYSKKLYKILKSLIRTRILNKKVKLRKAVKSEQTDPNIKLISGNYVQDTTTYPFTKKINEINESMINDFIYQNVIAEINRDKSKYIHPQYDRQFTTDYDKILKLAILIGNDLLIKIMISLFDTNEYIQKAVLNLSESDIRKLYHLWGSNIDLYDIKKNRLILTNYIYCGRVDKNCVDLIMSYVRY